jgi:hypothetical protein
MPNTLPYPLPLHPSRSDRDAGGRFVAGNPGRPPRTEAQRRQERAERNERRRQGRRRASALRRLSGQDPLAHLVMLSVENAASHDLSPGPARRRRGR